MRNTFLMAGVLSIALVFFLMRPSVAWTPESSHPWPMFHGNYNHTGSVDVKGPRDGTLKWKFKAASGEENTPPPNSIAIASDGTIFLGAPKKVYALKPNGKVKWSKRYASVQGPALSEDGKTLYVAGNNSLLAFKAKNGEKKWKVNMGDSTLFGPTIGPDGTLYQASWDGYLYAIKPNGKRKWRYQTAGAVSYPASINKKGHIFLGGGDAHAGPDSYIYSLNTSGKLRWKYDTGSTRVGSPAIGEDGLLYFPSAPTLFVLTAGGELAWKMGPETSGTDEEETQAEDPGESPIGDDDDEDVDGPSEDEEGGSEEDGSSDDETGGSEEDDGDIAGIISPAIGPDGTVYIGNSQGEILAINPDTQEVKWTYATGPDPDDETMYGLPSFPVVDNKGAVYIGSVDGFMYALSKAGELLWKYETGGGIGESAPALGPDGTLYFSSDDGYLYAVQDE